MSDFSEGDRVRVVDVTWLDAIAEEKEIIGSEGTVVGLMSVPGMFEVQLDDMPEWWTIEGPIPLTDDELEKL